ncbi:unconventional prefoldin RPB5 interactor-like protein [Drosophila serrata]|uniref:unconventional prefoldin RPB5 interactor-like protein n=1 Tax=Drosophila serrata TaxID=7274 RepID=UPI000A1D32AC|nr:unconventional prefoldin RPB5 interactor-like protein [Drosophila serrata]
MNRQREDILRQALDKNAFHAERWQNYKSDNENTIRNLDLFSQKLSVDIMVPIGKKALMPGELIHTNELLVSHYEGYFSACSAHKAKEICSHRIKLAEEHLKQLEIEADLWQNKLNTPLEEGAVPSGDQVEIVEDFNEESHNKWMEEHKERVRQQKQEERLKRQAEPQKGDNDVLKKLEEREMIEELGLDPDDINEDMLEDLLNVEQEPTKSTEKPKTLTEEQESQLWEKLEAQEQNEAKDLSSEAEESLKSTDNIVRQLMSGEMETPKPKKRIGGEKITKEGEDSISDDEDVAQVEEVKTIREQISLLPSEEREGFLRAQLNILKAKMRRIQKANFISDELIHLMNVVVVLEDDLQDLIFEQELENSEEEKAPDETANQTPEVPKDSQETGAQAKNNTVPRDVIKLDEEKSEIVPENGTKTRRISFAISDEKLEFRREETVAEMLPNARKNSRDVIKLDDPVTTQPVSEEKPNSSTNEDILKKVQRNIEFVKENQSVQDFDLLNQILEASTGRINTLHINFKHSDAVPSTHKSDDQDDADIPGNPADFYKKYEKDLAQMGQSAFPIYVNGFDGEENVKVPIMSEAARGSAYEDPRSEFSKPSMSHGGESTDSESTTKSILRNKSAVELEPRVSHNQNAKKGKKSRKQRKKERTLDDDLRDMSAYQKVMHDLVEKEEPTAPEPLPKGKFIDAHAPKKRVSRFKEQRAALSKT